MANAIDSFHSRYAFRASTATSTASTLARNPTIQKRGRTILPLTDSPSLTVESQDRRTIDPEKSAIKSHLRVQNYWIDAVIEKVVNTQFSRGRTHLQGSQAPQGWQAAHFSLAPHTVDDLTENVIESVVDKGLTPSRSKPFLCARIDLTSPDGKVLQANHSDPVFVRDFILSKLPSGAEDSSLYGTRLSLSRNATFENPDESNQFDTLLEKAVKPLLKRLQAERSSGEIDEDASTEQLVEWLIRYYETSIANNKQRLDQLGTFFALQCRLSQFEDLYSLAAEIPPEKLQEYIAAAQELLDCKVSLLTQLAGTSRCHGIREARKDYYYLTGLVRASNHGAAHASLETLFFKNVRHFMTRTEISAEKLMQKYEFFVEEATAQLDGIRVYSDPCTIPGLKTALFGVCVEGVRIEPTETQLREQIFSIFKIATPYKSKCRSRLFDKENQPSPPESPIRFDKTSASKRLKMMSLDSEDSL
ncbi:MAG: hypothetical protein JSR39_01185 [Verrucomicrobia bacterium]|nr:hypothetical protein [Verrucomicrobiota bacterium]